MVLLATDRVVAVQGVVALAAHRAPRLGNVRLLRHGAALLGQWV